MAGIYRTRVGYTGGESTSPTYHNLGNHTEAMQVDFDPQQITFANLVDAFWRSHNPMGHQRSRQYMIAIWFHDSGQEKIIQAAKEAIESKLEGRVSTLVMPFDVFYLAEDYHQKYALQNSPLKARFKAMYPEFAAFNNSTAAARLNGFVAGHGSRELFAAEHESYGFPSAELKQAIRL